MTFKEKLIKLRKKKGITQDEFASAVGVSRQSVYKWESGQSYPEVMKLVEIKKLFDISIDDLLDDNYEVVIPEKKKKRISKSDRERIEREVEIEEAEAAPETVTETVEAEPEAEAAPAVEDTVEEVAEETPAAEPETANEEPKKKGFFARLFGW